MCSAISVQFCSKAVRAGNEYNALAGAAAYEALVAVYCYVVLSKWRKTQFLMLMLVWQATIQSHPATLLKATYNWPWVKGSDSKIKPTFCNV
jgi:hypothetical protein